jgi:four helix bundle suffix protein
MSEGLIPAHGGYRKLKSFQTTTIIYDLAVDFCNRFVKEHRMRDQMVQAARSGRQNIAEGCQASGTSKKTELKLVGVARASLEELLLDFEDFLRQRNLPLWGKEHVQARKVRELAYLEDRSYPTYKTHCENEESAANTAICLIHQANYLLDRQLKALEDEFVSKGGFTERLYRKRIEARSDE